ncbi:hypothetical protein Q4Q49_02430 [Shewanella sp. SP1S1-7]|uniref:hypothetical protein n=1 Tax=Shewanella sp. SP1S1-7 TaxID=3063536 RepID=UPI002892680D|nr:hypothetical protein [Shewanella sp. SP1S1-7]MDT3334140.1 hypothetical protein [Shewanella sp. SP1S1-7]
MLCDVFKKLPSDIRAMPYDDQLILAEYCTENKCGAEWETRRFYRMIDVLSAPHMTKGKSFKPSDIFPEQYAQYEKVETSEDRVAKAFNALFAMAVDEQEAVNESESVSESTSRTALALNKS